MPLSHLGITLPGLYDTIPQYNNHLSVNVPSQSHVSYSSLGNPRSLAGEPSSGRGASHCQGICSAQGRRCNQCQGTPSHPSGAPISSGTPLYNLNGPPVASPTTSQDLHPTGSYPRSGQYNAPSLSTSSSTLPSSGLYRTEYFPTAPSRAIPTASAASLDGNDTRGAAPARDGYQQHSFSQQPSRGASLFAYDIAQTRPLAGVPAYTSNMPSMSHWTAKDQAVSPGSSPSVGSLPGAYPCIAYPSWVSLGGHHVAANGSGVGGGGGGAGSSDSSSLRQSSSSSSSGTTPHPHQTSAPRYAEYSNPSPSALSPTTSAYPAEKILRGSATDVRLSVPDLASSSPWSSGSVQIRDAYTRPVSLTMEYQPPPQETLYSHTQAQYYPQYLSPAMAGSQGAVPNAILGGGGMNKNFAGDFTSRSMTTNIGNDPTRSATEGMGGSYTSAATPQGWQSRSNITASPSIVSPSVHQTQSGTSIPGTVHDSGYHTTMRQTRYTTDEAKWDAVARRSHHADRYYLFGTSTTHIYCRPSCASKRPARERVHFFPQPGAAAAAEAAGYRSCRRCKPDRLSGGDQTVAAVGECVRHMMMAATTSADGEGELKKLTLKEYAARAGLSTFHFHRSLAKVMSITPGEFSKACQSLALQDALGRDSVPPGAMRISSRLYDAALIGWSSRRAKRALGNLEPNAYAIGSPPHPVVRTSVRGTEWGNVSLVYSAPSSIGGGRQDQLRGSPGHLLPPSPSHLQSAEQPSLSPSGSNHSPSRGQSTNSDRVLLAVLITPDADHRLATRFPSAQIGDTDAQDEVYALVTSLVRTGLREEQLPEELVPSIRRARLWAAVRLRLAASGTNGSNGSTNGNGNGNGNGTGNSARLSFSETASVMGMDATID